MASTDTLSVLGTFQSSIDDIRHLASCKVCLRPFYEPFMLQCGHTFCYGCLRSWFCGGNNRKKKKNCPECRSAVKDVPAPNYILRDLAHMFIDRAELLPEGETLEEHHAGKSAEAKLLADDRKEGGPGLFKNVFMNADVLSRAVWDQEDRVHRCPRCNWELEDGMCNQCGYEDSDGFTDSVGIESTGDDGHAHISDAEFPASYASFHPSPQIPIRLPHYGDDGRAISEDDDGTMDHTDDDDPIPWGYPTVRPPSRVYEDDDDDDDDDEDDSDDESDNDEDNDDDEDAWEDEDEMESFIDDDDYPGEVDYDSAGYAIEDYTRRPWPSSPPSSAAESSIGIPSGGAPDSSSRSRLQVYADSGDEDVVRTSIRRRHGQILDEPVTDYDESLDEDRQLTPAPIGQSQRTQRRRVVLDESEEDDADDHFEDAITGNKSDLERQNSVANSVADTQQTNTGAHGTNNHSIAEEESDELDDIEDHEDDDGGDDDDDGDDEDEDIVLGNSRSRVTTMHHKHRGRRPGQRRQRNFDEGHGFHPYARRSEASSASRRRHQRSDPRGDSQTTVVY